MKVWKGKNEILMTPPLKGSQVYRSCEPWRYDSSEKRKIIQTILKSLVNTMARNFFLVRPSTFGTGLKVVEMKCFWSSSKYLCYNCITSSLYQTWYYWWRKLNFVFQIEAQNKFRILSSVLLSQEYRPGYWQRCNIITILNEWINLCILCFFAKHNGTSYEHSVLAILTWNISICTVSLLTEAGF